MGYIVRFIRADQKPNEEYYYQSEEAARYHFNLFRDDDSGLYSLIELIEDSPAGVIIDTIRTEV